MLYVLDASAMIAYLRAEAGAAVVLAELVNPQARCHAHAMNLCEVFYDFHRASGRERALSALEGLYRLGVRVNSNMTPEIWQSAGTVKSIHRRVSLADCFAIALAQHLGATILTSDHHEFDALATQGVCDIRFIR